MTTDQLCQYIRNTAQVPLRLDDFDDDWSPIGDHYRQQLVDDGLIEYRPGVDADHPAGLVLTDAGLARTAEPGTPEAIAISKGEQP